MTADQTRSSKPGRWQFSLRTLLVAVAFVAVGSALLANAKNSAVQWFCFIGLLTTLGLPLVARLRRNSNRAFWSGFQKYALYSMFLLFFLNAILIPMLRNLGIPSSEILPYAGVASNIFIVILAYLGGLLAR